MIAAPGARAPAWLTRSRRPFGSRRAVDHPSDPRVDHGAHAHLARLDRHIDRRLRSAGSCRVALPRRGWRRSRHERWDRSRRSAGLNPWPITCRRGRPTAPTGTSPHRCASAASSSAARMQRLVHRRHPGRGQKPATNRRFYGVSVAGCDSVGGSSLSAGRGGP